MRAVVFNCSLHHVCTWLFIVIIIAGESSLSVLKADWPTQLRTRFKLMNAKFSDLTGIELSCNNDSKLSSIFWQPLDICSRPSCITGSLCLQNGLNFLHLACLCKYTCYFEFIPNLLLVSLSLNDGSLGVCSTPTAAHHYPSLSSTHRLDCFSVLLIKLYTYYCLKVCSCPTATDLHLYLYFYLFFWYWYFPASQYHLCMHHLNCMTIVYSELQSVYLIHPSAIDSILNRCVLLLLRCRLLINKMPIYQKCILCRTCELVIIYPGAGLLKLLGGGLHFCFYWTTVSRKYVLYQLLSGVCSVPTAPWAEPKIVTYHKLFTVLIMQYPVARLQWSDDRGSKVIAIWSNNRES